MRGLFGAKNSNRQNKKIEKILSKAKSLYDEQDYEAAFNNFSQAASLQSPEAQYWLGMCYLNGHGVILNLREAALWHESAATAEWADSAYMLALLYMRGIPQEEEATTGQNLFEQKEIDYSNLKPDLDLARLWARKAADQGLAEAQALYAYLISSGVTDQEVLDEALQWYDKAIALDSAQAYMGKGLLLLRLGNTQEEYAEAAKVLEIAAERKMGTAIQKLAVMYQTGQGVPVNLERAAELYKEAAELGIRESQALYGVALKNGQGVEQNFIQAETWLRKAALAGDVEAAVVLADMNGQGNDDIPPNYTEAARWYAFAAEKGHAAATRALGLLYLRGLGIPKSIEKGIDLLKVAAERGDNVATVSLGDIAIQLPESNLQIEDVIKDYLLPSAKQGNPVIMFNLAVALLRSNTVNPDPEKEKQAREWLKKSVPDFIPARYWYGRMLIQGAGGEQDSEGGYEWIASAANEGILDAQILWANILLESKSDNREALAKEAVKFYHMAADQGSVPAMFSLGAVYGGGNNLEPDRVKAQEWFTKAAEQGHAKAQLMLGRYLAQGLAGETNLKKARYWFDIAFKSGESEAEIELKRLDNPEMFMSDQLQDNENAISHKQDPGNVEVAPGIFFVKKK